MFDVKKLYTPREATALYNINKIRFNPMSYTLNDNLILSRGSISLSDDSIYAYSWGAELTLINSIGDKWDVNFDIDHSDFIKFEAPHIARAYEETVLLKQCNLSVDLSYLVQMGIDATSLKGGVFMDALLRMAIALDSPESCARELYWLTTKHADSITYKAAHEFTLLKNALNASNSTLNLPMNAHYGPAEWTVHLYKPSDISLYNTVTQRWIPNVFKDILYTWEFLWAYFRLKDEDLKRSIVYAIQTAGGCDLIGRNYYAISNNALTLTPQIEAMVRIDNPSERFEAYRDYLKANRSDILHIATTVPLTPTNPFVTAYLAYAQEIALTWIRINNICILNAFCKDNGLKGLAESGYEYEPSSEIALMLEAATSSGEMTPEKSLLRTPSQSSQETSESGVGGKAGNGSMFEALDALNASFSDGGYKYNVRDIRDATQDEKQAYEVMCKKIALMNRELIRQIKAIRTYNTGGKNPGLSSGRVNRSALYRHKYDANVFYNNTYKQLESDLAFGIILDCSGSMAGRGIVDGKTTMIVLHETLKALGINHSIIGHTSSRGDYTCEIERYQAFREDKPFSVQKNQALLRLSAKSCNCDSGALHYMAKAMERVQNKDKIILIFSDGYPTACTNTDLLNKVKEIEAKGIKVIGIGVNFQEISKFYTDYANGRNLKEMFDIISNILKEYILKKQEG